ncbi:hypothetical protein [Methylosinus sp. LW4]|uniref:hypothetical protein n=1 Tax=Methylosinus sp. LW4 TaxID=136993 RepID=UPI00036F12FE|nr:hypothetical protein [Methylosinus sp. LW4]
MRLFRSLPVAIVMACSQAHSAERPGFAGAWRCDRLCKVFDAGSSITIVGGAAECRDETGELSKGRLTSDRTIHCFGADGLVSADGEIIRWTNGSVWRRDHRTVF